MAVYLTWCPHLFHLLANYVPGVAALDASDRVVLVVGFRYAMDLRGVYEVRVLCGKLDLNVLLKLSCDWCTVTNFKQIIINLFT